MISKFKAWLGGGERPQTDDGMDIKVASAAILVEAAVMDGHIDDDEKKLISSLLEGKFELSGEDAAELFEAGRAAVAESSQLYGFTRTIKDQFSHEERVRMIEMLWEVAYVDGELHDYEANLVRRVAGLVYVSDRESGEAKKRVQARTGS